MIGAIKSLDHDSHWICFLSLGTETLAVIVPTIVGTTDAVIDRFDPAKRNCYNDDVRFLKTSLQFILDLNLCS